MDGYLLRSRPGRRLPKLWLLALGRQPRFNVRTPGPERCSGACLSTLLSRAQERALSLPSFLLRATIASCSIYGHPDCGGFYLTYGLRYSIILNWIIYVDDFKMAVPEQNMEEGWKLLGKFIDMDPAEVLGRYFGCMRHEETQVKLPPSAHPFHEVFEKGNKTAVASVRREDSWDIDPENMLAIKRHCYPRKRLYVPTEADVSMFPTMTTSRCTVALNQGGKEETIIQDDYNGRLSPSMSNWWTGETYFDLQGRDPGELKVAVAAARKGKPIRDKGQAKQEVKSNRFVTIGDDQKNKRVGCVTKAVNRVTYDMADFLESCVTRYCELAKGIEGYVTARYNTFP